MILILLLNKLKSFVLLFVNIFNRALCCLRKRRRSFCDTIPLTHVGVVSNEHNKSDLENWNVVWEDNAASQPKTVQDHIELYRKQKSVTTKEMNGEQLNFFDDMAPKITKQTKILISNGNGADYNENTSTNRLNFSNTIPTSELGEWEENSGGWEGETLDWVAQEALREKKKMERERRAWEQQQKRQERVNKSLGSRIST